jgi:Xaa-Pro dipeptidase
MSLATLAQSVPLSSAEIATVDIDRIAEVGRRHKLLADFMRQEGYSGVLLQRPANLAWLSGGARLQLDASAHSTAAAFFVTPEARVAICSNVETAQLFESDIANLGFQLKERPWTEPRSVMMADLCRGRKVAADVPGPLVTDVSLHLTGMRLPLSAYELALLRVAGRVTAHAVEATCRNLTPGRVEQEVAGELSHRLLKHGVTPERLQVIGDGRGKRFRHYRVSESTIQRWATVVAVGSYRGLHVGVARTVCLVEPSSELLKSYEQAALILATGMYFSQSGWELFEVWNRVKRIYEKSGAEDQWRLADQADVVEYELGSVPLMPTSEFRLTPGTPIYWHPSVDHVILGDTVTVTAGGAELVSPANDWPQVPVSVKGTTVIVPGILLQSQSALD